MAGKRVDAGATRRQTGCTFVQPPVSEETQNDARISTNALCQERGDAILAEIGALRRELEVFRTSVIERLDRASKVEPRDPFQPYTVKEFAALIRRNPEYVSDRCRTGIIKTHPGKPYRIKAGELERFLKK